MGKHEKHQIHTTHCSSPTPPSPSPRFHPSPSVFLFIILNALSHPTGTAQACLFRDSYATLTAGGLAIYGLSADSPRANTTFKDKQALPYPLLCDPAATLIAAIGLAKSPRGTARGIFAVDRAGKVLAAQVGSPVGTVDVARKLAAELAAAADGGGADGGGADDDAANRVAEKVEEGEGEKVDGDAAAGTEDQAKVVDAEKAGE